MRSPLAWLALSALLLVPACGCGTETTCCPPVDGDEAAEDPPPGYEVHGQMSLIRFDATASRQLAYRLTSDPQFAFEVPTIPGATSGIHVEARSVDAVRYSAAWFGGVPPGTGGRHATLREAPEALYPAEGTVGIDYETLFTTTPRPESVYVFVFRTLPSSVFVRVVTTETQVRFPDLTAYGIGLPSVTELRWRVAAWAPFASTDDLAGPYALHPVYEGLTFHTDSGEKAGTTAP